MGRAGLEAIYFGCSGQFDVYCGRAFFTVLNFKGYFVAIADLIDQAGGVYEDIAFGCIVHNKAETFGFIVELNGSLIHTNL